MLIIKQSKYKFIADLVLLSTWFVFFIPTFQWIFKAYSDEVNRFNLIIFALILALLAYKIFFCKPKPKFSCLTNKQTIANQKLITIAIVILIVAYILIKYFIDINLLATLIFGFATYLLSGLFISFKYWKRSLMPVLLLLMTLPFSNQFDIYLGFPLRVFSTEIVEQLLTKFGIQHISVDTILLIENRASNIDLSCSGMKSLWSGLIFFFAVTWIETKKINVKWIMILLVFIGLLITSNIIRIIILVLLEMTFNAPEVATKLHISLGIIGFVLSCIISWFMLSRLFQSSVNNVQSTDILTTPNKQLSTINRRFKAENYQLVLIPIFILGIFLYSEPNNNIVKINYPDFKLPSNYISYNIPLSENEKKFFLQKNNDHIIKQTFCSKKTNTIINNEQSENISRAKSSQNISGSFIITSTTKWRNHHPPEICLTNEGLEIKKTETKFFDTDFPVKVIHFNNKKQFACYWFQSSDKITDDFSSRIWASILQKKNKWTMISILFNQNFSDNKNIAEFCCGLKNSIKNK